VKEKHGWSLALLGHGETDTVYLDATAIR